MTRRINLENLKHLRKGAILADDKIVGFVARRLPSGTVSFGLRYTDRTTGRQRWLALKTLGNITPDKARELALIKAGEVAGGKDPLGEEQARRRETKQKKAAAEDTVAALIDDFLARYVKSQGLRSAPEVERVLRRYVAPAIGKKEVSALRRRDIVAMLDAIADENGAPQADHVLAQVRKMLNWRATRDDEFRTPIVPGMARTKPHERARTRILDDQEIRDLFAALDDTDSKIDMPEPYGRLVKTLLYTAARRAEISNAKWSDLANGALVIGAERDKVKLGREIPLTADALDALGNTTKGFIFSTTGGKQAFNGFSKAKTALDQRLAALREKDGREPMASWVLHDLRRTARSLMSRAGIEPDIAERVLGHVIGGVRGVYDRHQYRDEKRAALDALAALIGRILHPPSDNVLTLAEHR